MMSIQSFAVNMAIKSMAKKRGVGPKNYIAEREENARKSTVKVGKGIRCEQIELAGVKAEKIASSKNNGKTVLYLHGGGFTNGSAAERRWLTQALAKWYGYTCIAPDYRMSPENKWPCHLEDCYRFYLSLLETGIEPENLFFMGESAGGTLCLSLALRLRDEGLQLPRGIAVFSPFTDQSGSLSSHTKNVKKDPMVSDDLFKDEQYLAVFGQKPSMDFLKSPYVSPLYGEYTGLSPIFLSVSDTEVLYDDAAILYEKLKSQGHQSALYVKHGLCHAWPTFSFMPETRQTLNEMETFFKG